MKVLLNKIKWQVWYFVNWLKIKCSSIKELIKNLLTIVVILIKYPNYDERTKKLNELTKRKEKKIKELSEKELQNEKVIIDILRKCFEDKEDIASMAEGDNLEMLVEKVMELVRNLYL